MSGATNRPNYGEPRDLWGRDGSLRDVYIFDTTAADWIVLCDLAREYGHRYTYDGSEKPLPEVHGIFENRNGSHLLQITVGRLVACCHFFVSTEIELDLDPREVNGPRDHAEVLLFLERLSDRTSKAVFVTAENAEDIPYLQYDPHSREWKVCESARGHKQ